jgi:hypothetical protein
MVVVNAAVESILMLRCVRDNVYISAELAFCSSDLFRDRCLHTPIVHRQIRCQLDHHMYMSSAVLLEQLLFLVAQDPESVGGFWVVDSDLCEITRPVAVVLLLD